jgi:hypothetical protein
LSSDLDLAVQLLLCFVEVVGVSFDRPLSLDVVAHEVKALQRGVRDEWRGSPWDLAPFAPMTAAVQDAPIVALVDRHDSRAQATANAARQHIISAPSADPTSRWPVVEARVHRCQRPRSRRVVECLAGRSA